MRVSRSQAKHIISRPIPLIHWLKVKFQPL